MAFTHILAELYLNSRNHFRNVVSLWTDVGFRKEWFSE